MLCDAADQAVVSPQRLPFWVLLDTLLSGCPFSWCVHGQFLGVPRNGLETHLHLLIHEGTLHPVLEYVTIEDDFDSRRICRMIETQPPSSSLTQVTFLWG